MKCLFTGQETDSSEHVIPRWLQKRFHLENQKVLIPNGTTLEYKHVRVPAASEPNRKFGEIENRISRGILEPSEVYLWALKLHIGFIYRNSSLRLDIADREAPFVLDVTDFNQEVWFFQQLYANWAKGGTTFPSPFGSVFIVDSLNPTPQFDFMHCLVTGAVGVDIGGQFILVFLWDQGDAAHATILDQWINFHAPRVKAMAGDPDYEANCYIAPHVWACESAYWLYRHRRAYSMIKSSTQIALVPPLTRVPGRQPNEEQYRQVCRNFGLDLVKYNGEGANVYAPSFAGKGT